MNDQVMIYGLIVVMFFVSGVNKINTFDGTAESLRQKLGYEIPYRIVIAAVIALEIIAPCLILYYAVTGKRKVEAYYSAIALIIFTVWATLIYHFPDFSNYKKSLAFWANVSLVGGLWLMAKTIKSN